MQVILRLAEMEDVTQIESLIRHSCRELGRTDYTDAQIDGALVSAWGVDTQLIKDQTYYLAVCGDDIAGCGGWSFRTTLFGANNAADNNKVGNEPDTIDHNTGSARIRAFFVDPQFCRRGIGTRILSHCEQQAQARGYSHFSLMATLPGQRLYEQHGYVAGSAVEYPLPSGLTIRFVPMDKSI